MAHFQRKYRRDTCKQGHCPQPGQNQNLFQTERGQQKQNKPVHKDKQIYRKYMYTCVIYSSGHDALDALHQKNVKDVTRPRQAGAGRSWRGDGGQNSRFAPQCFLYAHTDWSTEGGGGRFAWTSSLPPSKTAWTQTCDPAEAQGQRRSA